MKLQTNIQRVAVGTILGTCLMLAPGASPIAATLGWTGFGATALWSDAANWNALRVPVDGDDLVFAGAAPRLDNTLDLSRTFASLAFATDAQAFTLHVQGSGAMLAFNGAGIRNLTAGSGPIRQQFFADAGAAGGSIVFTNNAGINLGDVGNFRPVDIIALGGSVSAAVGGHIVFQDNAATSGTTFDALRAQGASVAGALGGDISFRNNAVATKSSGISVTGGSAPGAFGAQASFFDLARVDGVLNVLAGESGGMGARATFAGQANASMFATIVNQGGSSVSVGSEAVTTFRDDAKLGGLAQNHAGLSAGSYGGRLEFHDRAGHDSTGSPASLGIVQIINDGSTLAGARGGSTVFFDDASVRGSRLLISNAVQGEGAEPGSAGGTTEFRDRSRAGQASIVNQGATTGGAGTAGGWTFFQNQASAESANITSRGGTASGAAGGNLRFADDATAGNATLFNASGTAANALGGTTQFLDRATAFGAMITNQGGSVAGAFGGSTDFSGTTTAGQATVVNAPGEVTGTVGGVTRFSGNAVAGTAYLSNNATFSVGGGQGGSTVFSNDANAQQATIDNFGGFFTADNASTSFHDRATAGQARITNFGGRAASAFGGGTSFDGNATAGSASIVLAGGGTSQALGGFVTFRADATAGSATVDVRAANVLGAVGSRALFFDRASAGGARISVGGSAIDHVLGAEGGAVTFANASTAADAIFTVGGNSFAGGSVGAVRFSDSSTAARASITLAAGQTRGGSLSFEGADASNLASAGAARISNQGSSTGAPRGLAIGGQTTFIAFSTAGNATITNAAGFGVGLTNFFATSTAGDATVTNLGGAAGEDGGITQFSNSSSAGRAVIGNQAGARGSSGFDAEGVTRFVDQASAGQARITAEGATSASAVGGLVSFSGAANPASATLIAEGGTNGGTGGRIQFAGLTNANQVRVILNAGVGPGSAGELDISAITVPGVAVGSVEGGGTVSLGSRNLTMWSPTADTSFSGLIRDGGVSGGSAGSLSVAGGATLTLTGANTYTGGTRIGDGLNAGSGKLVAANTGGSATGTGAVVVERGGTLAGSGFVAGPVTLMDGGLIAPGDPVTLTLLDSLTWNGGGVVRLVLGPDSAGSDHLNMHTLVRGAGSSFVIELIDFGFVAGSTYDLFRFDSLVGFESGDFSFSGISGTFALQNGALEFTTSPVPEPSAPMLAWLGLLVIVGVRWQRQPPQFGRSDAARR